MLRKSVAGKLLVLCCCGETEERKRFQFRNASSYSVSSWIMIIKNIFHII